MQGSSTTTAPLQDIDGRPVDTNNQEVAGVMNVINKDYSQLMKAIDKKREDNKWLKKEKNISIIQ